MAADLTQDMTNIQSIQSVQFHIASWIVTPVFNEVILNYFYNLDTALIFGIWASCVKWNKYERYNTKQDIRSILKVPFHLKKKSEISLPKI